MVKLSKTNLFLLVIIFFVVSGMGAQAYYFNHKINQVEKSNNSTKKDLRTLSGYDDEYRPAVLPKENLIAFPELKITLPYNDITKTLLYSTDNLAGLEARVSSTLLTNDHQDHQLDCNELVRITTGNAEPFNPWEEKAGTVKLADGRSINIVVSKAFKNNEASTLECASQVWQQITPQQIAAEFRKAQSY